MYNFDEAFFIGICALACGWFARMNGGAPPKTPEIIERALLLSPLIAFGFFISPIAGAFCLTSIALVGAGTGQWFLEGKIKHITPEYVDIFLRPFFGKDPRTIGVTKENVQEKNNDRDQMIRLSVLVLGYGKTRLWLRNFCGFMLTGLAPVLPLVISCAYYGQTLSAICVALAGLWMGPAYALGRLIVKTSFGRSIHHLSIDTEWGEFLRGFGFCVLIAEGYLLWQ